MTPPTDSGGERSYLDIFAEISALSPEDAMREIEPGGFKYLGVDFDIPKPVAALLGMLERDAENARAAAAFHRELKGMRR